VTRGFALSRRANRDIESANEWYARVSRPLAVAFHADVQRAIDGARERPASFPEVRRGVRRVLCERFPYRVYFETLHDRIDVLAVYHSARDDAGWNDPHRE
jgi:plasmid stabilization system protein ParE